MDRYLVNNFNYPSNIKGETIFEQIFKICFKVYVHVNIENNNFHLTYTYLHLEKVLKTNITIDRYIHLVKNLLISI